MQMEHIDVDVRKHGKWQIIAPFPSSTPNSPASQHLLYSICGASAYGKRLTSPSTPSQPISHPVQCSIYPPCGVHMYVLSKLHTECMPSVLLMHSLASYRIPLNISTLRIPVCVSWSHCDKSFTANTTNTGAGNPYQTRQEFRTITVDGRI